MLESPLLVTGCAGFIGFHLCQRLLSQGVRVVGVDCLNDYYDPMLKQGRLDLLLEAGLQFEKLDLSQHDEVRDLFQRHPFRRVIHLAAQAGVRYSLQNPHAYTSANIEAFLNILEACRHSSIEHLIYASSSSVYGANRDLPFSTNDKTDVPVSLYGATKKANELMAHSYSWMYGIPTTGLRFFTVYGPWGRPDMALYLFASAILEGRPIQLFNDGEMQRDFTYVDDVVEGIVRLLPEMPPASPGQAPARVLNIGNNSPVRLREFLRVIEDTLGVPAKVELAPLQSGDVVATYADIEPLANLVGFRPATSLVEGIQKSLLWYRSYRDFRGL